MQKSMVTTMEQGKLFLICLIIVLIIILIIILYIIWWLRSYGSYDSKAKWRVIMICNQYDGWLFNDDEWLCLHHYDDILLTLIIFVLHFVILMLFHTLPLIAIIWHNLAWWYYTLLWKMTTVFHIIFQIIIFRYYDTFLMKLNEMMHRMMNWMR